MSGGKRFWLAAASTCALVAAVTGAANADPTGAGTARLVTADCGATQVEMVTNGNGDFHAGHDLNSTASFVPVAVTDSGVFTDPAGGEHPFAHDEVKGSASPNGHPVVTCAFSVDRTFPDGARLVASGTLTGFFTS
jgi:hypothetical protein